MGEHVIVVVVIIIVKILFKLNKTTKNIKPEDFLLTRVK